MMRIFKQFLWRSSTRSPGTLMLTGAITLAASGCMPAETALPTASTTNNVTNISYSGFTGLTAADTVGPTKVKLTWNASYDPTVVAYNVYDVTLFFSPRLVKTVPAPATFTTVTNLANASLYSFRVRASTSSQLEDTNRVDLSAIPYKGATSVDVLSSTSARIYFEDGSNADEIDIFCKTPANPEYVLYKRVTNVNLLSTPVTGLTSGVLYTCRAALIIGTTTDNNTNTVEFTPIGQATQLVYSTEPGSAAAGANLSTQPVILIQDINGNTVTAGPDATTLVTLTLSVSSPTIGTIRGTVTKAAVAGVATFTGLYFQEAGDKIITATKTDTSSQTYGSGVLTADSAQFTISTGAVSPITSTIAVTPGGPLVANGSASYAVTITLADQYGNFITGVRPQFVSSNSGDSITQPAVNTNASGQSSGSIASTIAAVRTLSISSPSGLTSVSVPVTFIPGAATKLAFTQQPTNSGAGVGGMADIRVSVQDAQGNTVTTGASATASVSLAIFVNNGSGTGVLSGTTPITAVDGVATFSGMGISATGTGYKLVANSAPLSVAYSNAFNVTAAVAAKIAVAGPSSVLAGSCSTSVTFQLQDAAGNPSNATANTPITITGLGGASLYASSACTGAAATGTITFTSGSSLKTYYLKGNLAQSITITATDASSVLATGTKAMAITPSQIALTGPSSVLSGACSSAIAITTSGATSIAGPVSADTTVSLSGLFGSSGVVYSDSLCTNAVSPSSVTLLAGTSVTNIYLKDNKSESLSLSVLDPASIITTTSAPQVVNVLPSVLDFTTTVSTVVAGACSPAFTVKLKDVAGNLVSADATLLLSISGLTGTSGAFYTSPSCTGSPVGTTISIAQNATSTVIYFKDLAAENLALKITDPATDPLVKLTDSQVINIAVSPSALLITGPVAGTAKTSVCAGPFTLATLDGNAVPTNVITPITANLSGGGAAGTFYSDSECLNTVTSFTFATGESTKTFYFIGLAPTGGSPLTLTATDAAAVLTPGTVTWALTAAPAFVGTDGVMTNWFETGKVPVSARMDAPSSAYTLHLDATKTYLYVVDYKAHRILKYDYSTQQYIGWIGGWTNLGNIGIVGSNIDADMNAACQLPPAKSGWPTPGWCAGGQSFGNGVPTSGILYQPVAVTDDGTSVYVANQGGQAISKYDAATGTFQGWIGRVITSGAGAAGGSLVLQPGINRTNTCGTTAAGTVTPGWCLGGNNYNNYMTGGVGAVPVNQGDGGLYNPRSIVYATTGTGSYIFVGVNGMINRYDAETGQFKGWIGVVGSTATAAPAPAYPLATAPGASNTCASTGVGTRTPGWCVGGQSTTVNPNTVPGGVNIPYGLYPDETNDILYVFHTDNTGTITKYNLTTGAYIAHYSSLGYLGTMQVTFDGTYFYLADTNRILKVSTNGTIYGWIGKVSNTASMGGNAGCSTLVPNANTPGWCTGGTAKAGMDEGSFNALTGIEYDGAGHLLTGHGSTSYVALSKWNVSTGVYEGTLGQSANSPKNWSNASTFANYSSFDSDSLNVPSGSYTDTTNGFLYVAEIGNSRIKKINIATGAVVGMIGGITTSPTGGAAGCIGAGAMGPSPQWCLGSMPNLNALWAQMIPATVDGIMRSPSGLTGDGTYLYAVDYDLHRVARFRLDTGAFSGWIGKISTVPTGNATGSSGCSTAAAGTFTPGWCLGGMSTNSAAADGSMYYPNGITYAAGNIYVVDSANQKVNSYNATTGAFNGWIGAIGATNPTSGCSPTTSASGYLVSTSGATSGWCKGGVAIQRNYGDAGGGFGFLYYYRDGITTDGTYLYITNLYNVRIDRFKLSGEFAGSISTRSDAYYSESWVTTPAALLNIYSRSGICSYPRGGLYTDGTHLYGSTWAQCGVGTGGSAIYKVNLASGNMLGWKGAINTQPSGGDTGCSSAPASTSTPGWCMGGSAGMGYTLGKFSTATYISGDANFLYVSDEDQNRVTRLPK